MTTLNSSIGSESVPPSTDDAVNRAVQGAHNLVDRLAEKAGPAVDRLVGGVSSAKEALKTGADDISEMHERWTENCRGYVREHPLAAIGVAIVVGMLLSRFKGR